MSRGPGSGTKISSGRIRVDAARAVDKLRDYQLPDPSFWVLEVVRAAVAARATQIKVWGDADDVWIRWDGEPIARDVLPRLFDELVHPNPTAESRHLRLLATGVNTALGLDPRWIDVSATDGSGLAWTVRYTARLLEVRGDDGTAEGLRSLRAREVTPPPEAPPRGVLVHLRRLPMLGAVPVMLGFGEPMELTVVRNACADIDVPLAVGRSTLGRSRSHEDLLRIELDEGLDGFLALVDPSFADREAHLDVAELGVRLARYSLPPIGGMAAVGTRVPLRLFVDAPRMPTNASRSAVRLDEAPVRDALARVEDLAVRLLERLAIELGDGKRAHAWQPAQRERLRAAALGLLAAHIAGADWRVRLKQLEDSPFATALRKLAERPLVRDAIGRPRALTSFDPHAGIACVSFAADPCPTELEPWLGEVLWVPPGDPASMLLAGWDAPPARKLESEARRWRRNREAFLEAARVDARIAASADQVAAVRLRPPGPSLRSCVPKAVWALPKLEGEVVLRDPRRASTSEVRLLFEGRAIERVTLRSGVPMLAAVQHAELRPTADYRAVARGPGYEGALAAVEAGVVIACEALASRMARGRKERGSRIEIRDAFDEVAAHDGSATLARMIRAAIALAVQLRARFVEGPSDDAKRTEAAQMSKSSTPLAHAPVWPLAGGQWVSLVDLMEAAREARGAIGFSSRPLDFAVPAGLRPVVILPEAERPLLAALLSPHVLVDYGAAQRRGLGNVDDARLLREVQRPGTFSTIVQRGGQRAAVALGGSPNYELRHLGVLLERRPWPSDAVLAANVVVEDDAAVPNANWNAVSASESPPFALDESLVNAAAWFAHHLGTTDSDPRGPGGPNLALTALWSAIARNLSAPEEWLGSVTVAHLQQAPLWRRLGAAKRVSLGDLEKGFEGDIEWITSAEASLLGTIEEWHPLVEEPETMVACARLSRRTFVHAVERLRAMRQSAERSRALRRLRTQPEFDPAIGWPSPVVVQGRGFRQATVAPAASLARGTEIEVRVEGRPFVSRPDPTGLPLRLSIDFEESSVDAAFRGLTDAAEREVRYAVAAGARQLLHAVAERAPLALVIMPEARALLDAWLASEAPSEKAGAALLAELSQVRAFVSVQGPPCSIAEATEPAGVRVAAFEGTWSGPGPDEEPTPEDAPIVRLPAAPEERAALRSTVAAFHPQREVFDVSFAVTRRESERRIARGLAQPPRLGTVKDERFRYDLRVLLASHAAASEVFPLGEAAFDEGVRSYVHFFEGGGPGRTIEINAIPRVVVAVVSPLVVPGRPLDAAATESIRTTFHAVISHLLRRVVTDHPPEHLPAWLRIQLRTSCLWGGVVNYERLASTPMFETTVGTWKTPNELLAQRERFASVWWTHDRSRDWLPLDEHRFALRLTSSEAEKLVAFVPVTDATTELELDRVARHNRERPPVDTLAPTEEERALAIEVLTLEPQSDELTRGTVLLLRPEHADKSGLHVHLGMRPLGVVAPMGRWPVLAKLDHPALTPNRVWDAPVDDDALRQLRARVNITVIRAFSKLLPMPLGKLASMRALSASAAIRALSVPPFEAVAWLEPSMEPGNVHVHDARGESLWPAKVWGVAVPVHARIFFAGAALAPDLERVASVLYAALVERAMERAPTDPGRDHPAALHLLHALTLRIRVEVSRELILPCFVPEPLPLATLRAHLDGGGRVTLADDVQTALRVQQMTRDASPVLIDDGSPIARAVVALVGGRVMPLRKVVRTQVLGPDAALIENEPSPMAPKEVAAAGLDERLAQLAARLAPAPFTHVRCVRRAKPLATLEGSVLTLAKDHPLIRRCTAAVEGDAAGADTVVRLLLARVLAESRADDAMERQLGWMTELLT